MHLKLATSRFGGLRGLSERFSRATEKPSASKTLWLPLLATPKRCLKWMIYKGTSCFTYLFRAKFPIFLALSSSMPHFGFDLFMEILSIFYIPWKVIYFIFEWQTWLKFVSSISTTSRLFYNLDLLIFEKRSNKYFIWQPLLYLFKENNRLPISLAKRSLSLRAPAKTERFSATRRDK